MLARRSQRSASSSTPTMLPRSSSCACSRIRIFTLRACSPRASCRRRRRFTEAVLAGASAGVIGVDAQGRISILNRSAEQLIGHTEAEVLGHPLSEVMPELVDLFTTARFGSQRLTQGQVTISRAGRDR